jgi:hypothetical protein
MLAAPNPRLLATLVDLLSVGTGSLPVMLIALGPALLTSNVRSV